MPNWCSTRIKFFPNNATAVAALNDLKSTIDGIMAKARAKEESWPEKLAWEVDLEEEYGIEISDYKRGYFNDITEQDPDGSFTVYLEDAWGPNVTWWRALLDTKYGKDNIGILYTAAEEGMAVYLTNDASEMPMYNAYMSLYGFENCLKLDKCWEFNDNGPFAYLKPSGIYCPFISSGDSDWFYGIGYETDIYCNSNYDVLNQLGELMTVENAGISENDNIPDIFNKLNNYFSEENGDPPVMWSEYEFDNDLSYDASSIKTKDNFTPFG